MILFHSIDQTAFLKNYWQKKPFLFRQAIPEFINFLSPDELAGLALEEDIESRIVYETLNQNPAWHLKRGPFTASDFAELPQTHWTLLVQGVDKIVPEVYQLLDHFDFIPQWRIDDVMISYAPLYGSVGPHYDHYDVFLYQAKGRREWRLSTKNCTPDNAIQHLELRLMKNFEVEQTFLLDEGDMLYLPPHVGHYGISCSDDCMTYSFGYRSYQGQELFDSLGDYLADKEAFKTLYGDPNWAGLSHTSQLMPEAWKNAQQLLLKLIQQDHLIQNWFGCFATQLDQQAEQQLPEPLDEMESIDLKKWLKTVKKSKGIERNACCRFAYQNLSDNAQATRLYINGCEWDAKEVSSELIGYISNHRFIPKETLLTFLNHAPNQLFLYDLWKLQWINLQELE